MRGEAEAEYSQFTKLSFLPRVATGGFAFQGPSVSDIVSAGTAASFSDFESFCLRRGAGKGKSIPSTFVKPAYFGS